MTERAELLALADELADKLDQIPFGSPNTLLRRVESALRRRAAQDQKPQPAAGWNEAIEAAMAIAKDMRDKYSSPTGDQYTQGLWDQSQRIIGKIKAIRHNAPPDSGATKSADVGAGVPCGYALVPIKPTSEMIEAGCEHNPTQWSEGADLGFAADVANDVYVAMVRSALSHQPAPVATNASAEPAVNWQLSDDAKAQIAEIDDNRRNAALNASNIVAGSSNASAEATYRIGRWLSAALEDPNVCAEMKSDINAWMKAGKPNIQPSGNASAEALMPLSDINDLDAVVHILGIEDSDITPAEAVRSLHSEIEDLRTALSDILNTTTEERQNPSIWFPRVDAARALISAHPHASDCDKQGWLAKDVEDATKRVAE